MKPNIVFRGSQGPLILVQHGRPTALRDAMQFDQGSAANAERVVRKDHSNATPILALPNCQTAFSGPQAIGDAHAEAKNAVGPDSQAKTESSRRCKQRGRCYAAA